MLACCASCLPACLQPTLFLSNRTKNPRPKHLSECTPLRSRQLKEILDALSKTNESVKICALSDEVCAHMCVHVCVRTGCPCAVEVTKSSCISTCVNLCLLPPASPLNGIV